MAAPIPIPNLEPTDIPPGFGSGVEMGVTPFEGVMVGGVEELEASRENLGLKCQMPVEFPAIIASVVLYTAIQKFESVILIFVGIVQL